MSQFFFSSVFWVLDCVSRVWGVCFYPNFRYKEYINVKVITLQMGVGRLVMVDG